MRWRVACTFVGVTFTSARGTVSMAGAKETANSARSSMALG